MSNTLRHFRRTIARWLTVPIGLALALPTPASALRPEPDRGGLEEVLGRSPAAELEEDDDFIFELARSQKPLTAEDVYAVNAWVRQIPRYSASRYVREIVAWVNAVQGNGGAPSRNPVLSQQIRDFARWGLDQNDPVVLAAFTVWLFTQPRYGFTDATHRTAWLVMNILLHRAGYPMMAHNPEGHANHYYMRLLGDRPTDDARPLVEWIRKQVALAQTVPYRLVAAQVTDLTASPLPYRMLIRQPEGVKTPVELFTVTGPLRIVYDGDDTKHAVEGLIERATADGGIPGFTRDAVTLEPWWPETEVSRLATHTILIRSSRGSVRPEAPQQSLWLATVSLTPGITSWADVLRQALAQWAHRPRDPIRPFQRALLRGTWLDLYT